MLHEEVRDRDHSFPILKSPIAQAIGTCPYSSSLQVSGHAGATTFIPVPEKAEAGSGSGPYPVDAGWFH